MATYKLPSLTTFEWQQKVAAIIDAPAGGEVKGVRYIVGTGSGDFAAQDNKIATYNGSTWDFTTPLEGMYLYVDASDTLYRYNAGWEKVTDQALDTSASPVFAGLEVNGTITGANDETIANSTNGRWDIAGNLYLSNAGSSITFNEATDVVLTGADGQLNLTGNLDVSGLMAVGNQAAVSALYGLTVAHTFTDQTNHMIGAYVTPLIAPASSMTTKDAVGIGGYTYITSVNFGAGSSIAGLSFGNFGWVNNTCSTTDTTLVGIACFGVGGWSSSIRASSIVGLNVISIDNNSDVILGGDSGTAWGRNVITATNAYGIYIHATDSLGSGGTLTNNYQMLIEALAVGTNKYQVVLEGTGAGSGIWLGGITNNVRLFASAASVLDLAIGTTTILQVSANGFGYVAGVGGTVTQATSKSTTVTLNKVCGTITTHGATLINNTAVSFQVTNSCVTATDVVHIQHESGGTIGSYQIYANGMDAGHFHITIRNITGGNLAEALVLRFAVIKAVAS